MSFEDLKILFISTETFGIEARIKDKLIDLGADVDYFNERPSNGVFLKGIIRVQAGFAAKRINDYYTKILEDIKEKKYDYLFVIKGEAIPRSFLQYFIHKNPGCKRIFYTWDSIKNNRNALGILDLFETKYSFDDEDCTRYNFKLRPLFYFEEFSFTQGGETEYDLVHIGTAHSDRYELTQRLFCLCEEIGKKTYAYFYLQSRLVYLYKYFFDKSFKSFKLRDIRFKSLSITEIVDYYKRSRVILDINHPAQVGLTMRTFEAIGARRKLVTTNRNISKYPFYNENNILIISREASSLDMGFFKTDYQQINEEIYLKLSLEGWLREIFFGPALSWRNSPVGSYTNNRQHLLN